MDPKAADYSLLESQKPPAGQEAEGERNKESPAPQRGGARRSSAGSCVAKKEGDVAPPTLAPLSISSPLTPLLAPPALQGPSRVPPQGLCTYCSVLPGPCPAGVCNASCFFSFRSQLPFTSS